MSDEADIQAAFESLKKAAIETPIFLGSIVRLWNLIEFCFESATQPEDVHGESFILNSSDIQNIILLTTKLVTQISSKTDVVESVLKRQKYFDQLLQMESQLLSYFNPDFSLIPKSRNISELSFALQFDLRQTIEMILHFKYHSDRFDPAANAEHIISIETLIDVLSQQITHQMDINIPYWPRKEFDILTMKEFSELFPGKYQSEIIDEHTAKERAYSKSYGVTYRSIWQGRIVAVKKIHQRVFQQHELHFRASFQELHDLLLLQTQISCSYLLSPLGISWDEDLSHLYFIYPIAPFRSLYDVFSHPRLLPEHKLSFKPVDKISILLDVAKAIAYLHEHGYVHGRVKDSNIMLFEGNRVKLMDYTIHSYLPDSIRSSLKGAHGVRWTSPEVIQHEYALQQLIPVTAQKQRNNNNNNNNNNAVAITSPAPLLQSLSSQYQYPQSLSPAVDIYALGVLAVVLLTEHRPFYNIPWDEGVYHSLLEGMTPPLKATYPDQDRLQIVEEVLIHPCLRSSYQRPSAASLIPILQDLLCQFQQVKLIEQSTLRDQDILNVTKEIKEFSEKIEEHQHYIVKGKELLHRKEEEKLRAHDIKIKRERDLDIEKIRQKMMAFKHELEGLKEDKEGAEADL
jgi:serine/threonine protein kinase